MQRSQIIEHSGSVIEVNERLIRVNLEVQSACAACHARSVCNPGESKEKVVEINHWEGEFNLGEQVMVVMEQRFAFKAVFLGYLLPFLLILFTLIISAQYSKNELVTGVITLGILPVYYGILYLNKDRIRRVFSFRIEKLK